MSGQAPVRLPLSKRQADALVAVVAVAYEGPDWDWRNLTEDQLAALREVAGKLDTLREQ